MSTDSRWRKSRFSGAGSNECVELDRSVGRTLIRDSKAPTAGTLPVGDRAFRGLLHAVSAERLGR